MDPIAWIVAFHHRHIWTGKCPGNVENHSILRNGCSRRPLNIGKNHLGSRPLYLCVCHSFPTCSQPFRAISLRTNWSTNEVNGLALILGLAVQRLYRLAVHSLVKEEVVSSSSIVLVPLDGTSPPSPPCKRGVLISEPKGQNSVVGEVFLPDIGATCIYELPPEVTSSADYYGISSSTTPSLYHLNCREGSNPSRTWNQTIPERPQPKRNLFLSVSWRTREPCSRTP